MGSLKISSAHDNSILCYTKMGKLNKLAKPSYLLENQKQSN